MEKTSPFAGQLPAGALPIGQPFAITNFSLPVNATFACHCAVPFAEFKIVNSAPVTCPSCQKTYIVGFDPATQKIMVAIAQKDTQVIQ